MDEIQIALLIEILVNAQREEEHRTEKRLNDLNFVTDTVLRAVAQRCDLDVAALFRQWHDHYKASKDAQQRLQALIAQQQQTA